MADKMNPVPPPSSVSSGHEISRDGVSSLLATAHQHINNGNPILALQAVISALRASGGERAVMQALDRARDRYERKRQSNEAVDELSTLLAECALATDGAASISGSESPGDGLSESSRSQDVPMEADSIDSRGPYHSPSAPILAESGRLQVVMDASSDGSSFICMSCGGVVSNQRRDEHVAFWCTRICR